MSSRKFFVGIAALASVSVLSAQAQDFYRVNLHTVCTSLERGGGQRTVEVLQNSRILRGFGAAGQGRAALVYSPAADAIQVINTTDGAVLGDVLHFQGGAWSSDGFAGQRLTFVFVPNQSEAVGTAILRERVAGNSGNVRLSGTMQLVLTGDLALGGAGFGRGTRSPGEAGGLLGNTPNAGPPGDNVRICNVTFSIGRPFVWGSATPQTFRPANPFPAGTANWFAYNQALNRSGGAGQSLAGGALFGNQTANVAIGRQNTGFGAPNVVFGAPTGTGLQIAVQTTNQLSPTISGFTSRGAGFGTGSGIAGGF